MKKAILHSAAGAIALMLVSCSADEQMALNTLDGAIGYTVVADNQTRALHSYCSNKLPEAFYVWAKRTTTSESGTATEDNGWYIEGDRITKGDDDNVYTDADGVRYWPQTGSLSFYAFVDLQDNANQLVKPVYETTTGSNAKNFVVRGYTIASNPTQQHDLMYAVRTGATKDGNVQLNFRHALSQICFKAKNENPNSRIIIHSITVKNVYMKADFTLPATSTDGTVNDHLTQNNPTFSGVDGTWTSFAKMGNVNPINFTGSVTGTSLTGVSLDGETTAVDLTCGNDNSHESTTWYANALNLLPQTRQSTETKICFELKLTVQNKNSDGSYTDTEYGDGTVDGAYTATVNVDDFGADNTKDVEWKQGVRYIYTLHFPADWDPADKKLAYELQFADFKQDNEVVYNIESHEAVLMRASKADGSEKALYVATSNIGADNDPYATGLFFWWGDTKGWENETDDFKFEAGHSDIILTDKVDSEIAEYLNGNNLKLEKDAARQLWGGSWRMPTKEDFEWLITNCQWYRITNGNQYVYKVVNEDTHGVIYLPAAGYFETMSGISGLRGEGEFCFYWSSTKADHYDGSRNRAYRLKVSVDSKLKDPSSTGTDGEITIETSGEEGLHECAPRWNGFPIRPVANSLD